LKECELIGIVANKNIAETIPELVSTWMIRQVSANLLTASY
jgi:hypothetical protein